MAESKAKPCGECGQTFDNRLEGFLTVRLRQLSRDVEEKIDELFREGGNTTLQPLVKRLTSLEELLRLKLRGKHP